MLRAFGVAALPSQALWKGGQGAAAAAAEQDDKMPRQVLHSICRGGFMGL